MRSDLPWFEGDFQKTVSRLGSLGLGFTNHYSNYNRGKSWSALSLRGYTSDPSFITKPAEMNDVWREKHKDVEFAMQNTPLAGEFPEAMELARNFAGPGAIHRVRLMRLSSGGGELARHTDQVDKDSGIQDGKLMRVHIPLVTNPGVIFTVWGVDGKPIRRHFPAGSVFYIDTRKPHTAINGGSEDRVHLVMDLEATDHLRGLLQPN